MGLEPASVHASVRACVGVSTLLNINTTETIGPITIKFYLKHHSGRGKAALGFGADQFRTLVSMATESSHRVVLSKKLMFPLFLGCYRPDTF